MGIDRWRLPLPSLGVYSNSLGEAAEGALGTRSRAIRRFTSIACILLRLKRDVGKVAEAFCVYHYRLEAYATLSLQAGSLCYFETGAPRSRCLCIHGRDAHFTMRARRDTRMTWWSYALLSAACWGMQYLLLETLFGRVEFAAAFSFLSLVNGVMVASIMFVIYQGRIGVSFGEAGRSLDWWSCIFFSGPELMFSMPTPSIKRMLRWRRCWRSRIRCSLFCSRRSSCAKFIST